MIALVSFIILLFLGVPIAIVLGLVSIIYIFSAGELDILESVPLQMFNGLQNFGLVAIPMFILLGEIMNHAGITQRLIDFSKVILGHLKGGLAYVNVFANMLLASIVGSSQVQTAIMSNTIVPAMEKENYPKPFSTALTASSSTIGALLPPSMPLIIYGVTAGASIGSLFVAGIIPGLLLGVSFFIAVYVISKKNNFTTSKRVSLSEIRENVIKVFPSLTIPVIVVVGIISGVFTPTESAAIAVFIAIILGIVYKKIKIKDFPHIMIRTVMTTSIVTFLVATSTIFGWVLTFDQVPQAISNSFLMIAGNTYIFLFLVIILLLIVGSFMDGIAAIILLTPILVPIATEYGVDPVHFGIIMVLMVTLGLLIPPVGTVLFIASSITNVRIEILVKSLIPFLLIAFGVVFIITYVSGASLFLPDLFDLN